MLALRSEPPSFGIEDAARAAHDLYGLTLTLRPLSGERDRNFYARDPSGREYVLKIIDADAAPRAADCQIAVLRHLAEHDPALAVPRPALTLQGEYSGHISRDGRRMSTCLLTYLRGQLLTECLPSRALLMNVGAALARLDAALVGFFHLGLGQRIAWDVRRLPELLDGCDAIAAPDLRERVRQVIGMLRERLPALRRLRAQAIHGDCHAGNLLVDAPAGAVCGVLDFGDMIHAPLILEPAVSMSELLTEGVTEFGGLTVLLEAYAAAQALTAAEVDVLYDLVTARHAATIVLHAWRARHDPAGAALLEKSAAAAAVSLDDLTHRGAETVSREWHRAAGTDAAAASTIDLGRRQRLLGVGAELFYETPLHIVRGDGVWLYDEAGRAHLDCYNNVPHVGHCHPAVVHAIQRQTARLATHTRYLHGHILDYAERLLEKCPAHLDACIFVNSGSEANDVAWRIAQFVSGRGGALIVAHAYHGITAAAAALTPGAGQPLDPRVEALSPPPEGLHAEDALTEATHATAAADAARAVRTLAERGFAPAAFFIDTAMTSSGIYDPPPGWMDAVATRVRAVGGLIVADEVQYGLARSGSHFWGFDRRGLVPDIITLGKPMGNGYPMGAVIANRHMIEAFQRQCGFFSTFGGNPVAAAAGLAVLDVLEREGLRENAAATGAHLRRGIERLGAKHACLGAVRGSGLLLGLDILGRDAAHAKERTRQIVNDLASRSRILIGSEGPAASILKLRPPLTFRPEHADLLVEAIGLAALRGQRLEGQ